MRKNIFFNASPYIGDVSRACPENQRWGQEKYFTKNLILGNVSKISNV